MCKCSEEVPLVFLGHEMWLEVRGGKRVLIASQEKYAKDILERFGNIVGPFLVHAGDIWGTFC